MHDPVLNDIMTSIPILIGRSGRRHATMTESTRVSTCSIELSSKLRLQLAEPLASTNGMDLHHEKPSPSGLTKESMLWESIRQLGIFSSSEPMDGSWQIVIPYQILTVGPSM